MGSSQKERTLRERGARKRTGANKGGGGGGEGVKTQEFPNVLFECPLMWMKNVNNFQIVKVRPQSVA